MPGKIYMQSKVLATPLTLGIQMSRRVERKRGPDCWMNQMTHMSQLSRSGYWALWLLSQPASRHTVSESASQSTSIQSLGTWCVRDFVDCGDAMWGFNAATCELNLCLLGACRHPPTPPPPPLPSPPPTTPLPPHTHPAAVPSPAHWQLAQIHW